MPRRKPSSKLAITVDPEVHEIMLATAKDSQSVSTGLPIAAREDSQHRAGLAAVAQWEKQHGHFTVEEMNEARSSVVFQLRNTLTSFRSHE